MEITATTEALPNTLTGLSTIITITNNFGETETLIADNGTRNALDNWAAASDLTITDYTETRTGFTARLAFA